MAKRPGTMALVNWRVANRWADGGRRSATVNAADRPMANSIKALGSTKIFLTVFHEPENDISPGGDPDCPTTPFNGSSGTTASYVDMWHNVRARFDALGVDQRRVGDELHGLEGLELRRQEPVAGQRLCRLGDVGPLPEDRHLDHVREHVLQLPDREQRPTHDFMSKPWGLAEFGYVGSSQTAAYAMYDEAAATCTTASIRGSRRTSCGTSTPPTATTTAWATTRTGCGTRSSRSTTTRSPTTRC